MSKENNFNQKYLLIGISILSIGLTATILFFLFIQFPNIYLFLVGLYTPFSLISIGLLFLLAAFEIMEVSKMRILLLLLILLFSFLLVIGLDVLIRYLFSVL